MPGRNIEITPVGSWTLKRQARKRGVEPDECYIFGADAPRRSLPDLAIEVERSHRGTDKLDVYARLGVREVWRWSGGRLHVHVLRGKRYVRAGRSHVLPDLDLALLARFVESPTLTRAVRGFRAALARRG